MSREGGGGGREWPVILLELTNTFDSILLFSFPQQKIAMHTNIRQIAHIHIYCWKYYAE